MKNLSQRSIERSASTLQFEQCEARNMLSVSGFGEIESFVAQGHDELVLNYLADQQNTAYLQQGSFDLQLVDVETSQDLVASKFQQTMDGIPIAGSYVTVAQTPDGKIQSVQDRAFPAVVTQDSLTPSMELNQAQLIANSGLKGYTSDGHLVWFHDGEQVQLSWQVESLIAGLDVNNTDVLSTRIVDADTGEVLSETQESFYGPGLVNADVQPRIVINDTIGAAGSRAYAAPFDSVVEVNNSCTGALIAPNVVISARHCGVNVGNSVDFGDNGNSPDFTAVVQSVSLPDGNGSLLDGGDVAILTLTANVPSNIATPMRFIDETTGLVGQTASLNGYGFNGLGSVGHNFTADGWRWGGENIIDVYGTPAGSSGSNIISTDFDDGSGANNTIGGSNATPLQFEATTAPGDSGGAVFVQLGSEWLIGGVLSGGTSSTSVYGDISWWTGTAIYRSQIEAAGGEFFGGGAGTVGFDQATYLVGDNVIVNVTDDNAVNPVSATVTSDSGDSETLSLTNGGSGVLFSNSIITSDAPVSTEDGTLQVSDGDTITVTNIDADDGTGNSNTVTATATVIEPVDGAFIGVDFDEVGSSTPGNWLLIGGGSDATFSELNDEAGNATAVDLAINELTDGTWGEFSTTVTPATIPTHANSIADIGGQIFTGGDPIRLTYQDLNAGSEYQVYVLAADSFFTSIEQQVTITGEGSPVVFDQIMNSGELAVNGQIGSSAQTIDTYAQLITANASGEIQIDIAPIAGTQDVVLVGAAIVEVPVDTVIGPLGTKYLDGSIASGTNADAALSDDVYLQLNPTATTNPFKQKIDVLLLAEYAGMGTPTSFEFRLEARMLGGPEGDVMQVIELWNDADEEWEILDTRATTATDSVVQVAASGDLSRFVHPFTNEIISRITFESPAFAGSPFNWTVDVDQFGWLIA